MSILGDVRNATHVVLEAVKAANPTVLKQTYSARPAALGALTCAWVDQLRMRPAHSAGVRRWDGEIDVYVCSGGLDNEEKQDAMDAAAVLIVDAFTDNPHFISANSVGEPTGIRGPINVDAGNGQVYPALVVTIGRIITQEGR